MTIDLPKYADSYRVILSQWLIMPKLSNTFTRIVYKKLFKLYSKILLELTGYQSYIHGLTEGEAKENLKSLERFHVIIKSMDNHKAYFATSELKQFVLLVHRINLKLNENVFLLHLVITNEFDKSMSIDEMLEDYYDGLEAEKRRNEAKMSLEDFLKLA